MEEDYQQVIDDCDEYDIPITKKNGDLFSLVTLKKKIKDAKAKEKEEEQEREKEMMGGALTVSRSSHLAERIQSPKKSIAEGGIVRDPFIQAYLKKSRIKKVTPDTTVPLGIVLAVYGNHTELGASGLGDLLPNFLDDEGLKEFWQKEGTIQITPQTKIPLKYIYLLKK